MAGDPSDSAADALSILSSDSEDCVLTGALDGHLLQELRAIHEKLPIDASAESAGVVSDCDLNRDTILALFVRGLPLQIVKLLLCVYHVVQVSCALLVFCAVHAMCMFAHG